MTNEETLKLVFAVGRANLEEATILFDVTDPLRPVALMTENVLNAAHFNLFSSAPILYQTLYSSTLMLSMIRDASEAAATTEKERNVVKAIDFHIDASLMAMRTVTEGIETIIKEMTAESLSKMGKL